MNAEQLSLQKSAEEAEAELLKLEQTEKIAKRRPKPEQVEAD